MTLPEKPPRITGLRHVLAAARYSVGGGRRVWQETAFRHEILGASVILILFGVVGASLGQFVGAIVLVLATMATEALNTAIECLVDHVSPEWSVAARDAKDLGSFACACMLVATGGYAAFVILSALFAGAG